MIFAPAPLGSRSLSGDVLKEDRKNCRRFGPCGVGKEALYLGGRFLDRRFYLPWREVKRVFKRVAMSRGGFTGRGIFGSLPFLVVQYGNGKEKECPFKLEADVDRLLALVEQEHPKIPTHSARAERKLAAAEAEEEKRYLKELSPEAAEALSALEGDLAYLEQRPSLSAALTSAAKQKRIVDNMKPAYRVIGALLAGLGILAALGGLYVLLTGNTAGVYFIVGGGAAFFMALSSNTMPSRWNSPRYAQAEWDGAVEAMRGHLRGRPGFRVPAQYAHPVVLLRMMRVLRQGRAQTAGEALAVVKEDLRALNSSVQVTQKEHDEVVAVKPLFLVCDYQDEIQEGGGRNG